MARGDGDRIRLAEAPVRSDGVPAPAIDRCISALPEDAEAVIERSGRCVMQAGRRRERHWILRFPRRGRLTADPLTGWTSGSDPLASVSIPFPSRETSLRYARRNGLRCRVADEGAARRSRTAGCLYAWSPLNLWSWPPAVEEKGDERTETGQE